MIWLPNFVAAGQRPMFVDVDGEVLRLYIPKNFGLVRFYIALVNSVLIFCVSDDFHGDTGIWARIESLGVKIENIQYCGLYDQADIVDNCVLIPVTKPFITKMIENDFTKGQSSTYFIRDDVVCFVPSFEVDKIRTVSDDEAYYAFTKAIHDFRKVAFQSLQNENDLNEVVPYFEAVRPLAYRAEQLWKECRREVVIVGGDTPPPN